MEEAERLCSRVGIIDRGKLIALDTPRRLIDRLGGGIIQVGAPAQDAALAAAVASLPAVAAATWAFPPGGAAEAADAAGRATPANRPILKVEAREGSDALVQVINLFSERNIAILSLEVLEPNLETVFLHLTGKSLRD
jgi:ABC-2 type transport system ATP-binding protein